MTSSERPPEEPIEEPYQDAPPAYASVQAQEIEEALEEAESSLGPIIATLLAAEAARQLTPSLSSLPTAIVLRNLLLPLVLFGLRIARNHAPRIPFQFVGSPAASWLNTGIDTGVSSDPRIVAENALDDTLSKVQRAVQKTIENTSASNKKHTDNPDVIVSPGPITPHQADVAAKKMARWIARDALFGAQMRAAADMGYSHKRWVTERDARVRDAHRILDGQTVEIGGIFQTTGGNLRYPGDITAPAGLVLNCRCSLEMIRRQPSK